MKFLDRRILVSTLVSASVFAVMAVLVTLNATLYPVSANGIKWADCIRESSWLIIVYVKNCEQGCVMLHSAFLGDKFHKLLERLLLDISKEKPAPTGNSNFILDCCQSCHSAF